MIQFEHVNSVYSGRPGCCCGCRGKHTHRHGTEKYEHDRANDTVVRRHLKLINANLDKAEIRVGGFGDDVAHVAVEFPNRLYIAYLGILASDIRKMAKKRKAS